MYIVGPFEGLGLWKIHLQKLCRATGLNSKDVPYQCLCDICRLFSETLTDNFLKCTLLVTVALHIHS